jgi:hypothetical protein
MIATTTKDPWTGTVGRDVDVVVIQSPDQNLDIAIRIAKASVENIIREFGSDEAGRLTINEILELDLDL